MTFTSVIFQLPVLLHVIENQSRRKAGFFCAIFFFLYLSALLAAEDTLQAVPCLTMVRCPMDFPILLLPQKRNLDNQPRIWSGWRADAICFCACIQVFLMLSCQALHHPLVQHDLPAGLFRWPLLIIAIKFPSCTYSPGWETLEYINAEKIPQLRDQSSFFPFWVLFSLLTSFLLWVTSSPFVCHSSLLRLSISSLFCGIGLWPGVDLFCFVFLLLLPFIKHIYFTGWKFHTILAISNKIYDCIVIV